MTRLSLRADDVSWTTTDTGGVVVLDLRTSRYLQLNGSGALLWQTLADGADPARLAEHLVTSYGIDAGTARDDVARFVTSLRSLDLVDDQGA